MSYYINKTVTEGFDQTVQRVTDLLKREGFGVLTEIDVDKVFKQKLDVDFTRYKILGACNPDFAYKAIQGENKVGTMLPCNVIVRESSDTEIEVAAVDPIASMLAIDNPSLREIAVDVREKLSRVIRDT
ncbi:MAG: DUF302 domain-containing protein [Cyclobacteriaceae bacterium]